MVERGLGRLFDGELCGGWGCDWPGPEKKSDRDEAPLQDDRSALMAAVANGTGSRPSEVGAFEGHLHRAGLGGRLHRVVLDRHLHRGRCQNR